MARIWFIPRKGPWKGKRITTNPEGRGAYWYDSHGTMHVIVNIGDSPTHTSREGFARWFRGEMEQVGMLLPVDCL